MGVSRENFLDNEGFSGAMMFIFFGMSIAADRNTQHIVTLFSRCVWPDNMNSYESKERRLTFAERQREQAMKLKGTMTRPTRQLEDT